MTETLNITPELAGPAARQTEDLFGGIIHDFNNQLTALTGYTDFLEQDIPAGDPRRADVSEIRQIARRAADVSRQFALFLMDRPGSARVFCVDDVLVALQKLLHRVIREDVRLRMELHAEAAMVHACPAQLNRVVLEIVVGARRAMPMGGELVVESHIVRVGARDQGMSLPAGDYVVLTIRDASRSCGDASEPGSKVVRWNSGYVVGDFPQHQRACARLYLPRVDQEAKEAPAPAGGETILLVEDEDALRVVAKRALGRRGYVVIEASNGAEALEVAAAHSAPIDLLLTDIVMPVMGGHQLAKVLTAQRPTVRVLFVSGYAPDVIGSPRLDNGRASYLEKPFSTDQLAAAVRNLLDADL